MEIAPGALQTHPDNRRLLSAELQPGLRDLVSSAVNVFEVLAPAQLAEPKTEISFEAEGTDTDDAGGLFGTLTINLNDAEVVEITNLSGAAQTDSPRQMIWYGTRVTSKTWLRTTAKVLDPVAGVSGDRLYGVDVATHYASGRLDQLVGKEYAGKQPYIIAASLALQRCLEKFS